jgi:hypothetical protein
MLLIDSIVDSIGIRFAATHLVDSPVSLRTDGESRSLISAGRNALPKFCAPPVAVGGLMEMKPGRFWLSLPSRYWQMRNSSPQFVRDEPYYLQVGPTGHR